jgi:hypothetical protein
MAEQGSDSATTEASVAALVRQLLDQSTRLARQEGALARPGCLLPVARSRSQSWSEHSGCLWWQDRPAVRPCAGRAAYPQ